MKLLSLLQPCQLGRLTSVCLLLLLTSGCKRTSSTPASSPNENSGPGATAVGAPQDRYTWNLNTLVEPYAKAGFAGAAWDEPARRALVGFASLRSELAETNGAWISLIATNCEMAIRAGCKDPMIQYLHLRFPPTSTSSDRIPPQRLQPQPLTYWQSPAAGSSTEVADALCQVALEMKASSYPAVRKFYASRRASQEIYTAYGSKADPQVISRVGGIVSYLSQILQDPTVPVEEAYDACAETVATYGGMRDVSQYEAIYQSMEKQLMAKWPNDYRPWLLKGAAHVTMAWICRGGGYADTVSSEGRKGFEAHLRTAEQALARAWKLDQNNINIPLQMMRVELGQGQGRQRMDLWFQRAMAIDTNSFEACYAMLFYLEPKWYGSAEDMQAFGRQCVQHRDWGGEVPLILVRAHETIQNNLDGQAKANYWKRPEVWADIQAAYERFFEANPDDTRWYHEYVQYAYQCERWDKVNELLPKMGYTNVDYFGGQAEFDKMVKQAQERGRPER